MINKKNSNKRHRPQMLKVTNKIRKLKGRKAKRTQS